VLSIDRRTRRKYQHAALIAVARRRACNSNAARNALRATTDLGRSESPGRPLLHSCCCPAAEGNLHPSAISANKASSLVPLHGAACGGVGRHDWVR